jgi:hypothetical protein
MTAFFVEAHICSSSMVIFSPFYHIFNVTRTTIIIKKKDMHAKKNRIQLF